MCVDKRIGQLLDVEMLRYVNILFKWVSPQYGDPYQNGHSIEDAIGSCLSVIELIVATALTYVTSTRRGAAWRQRHVR